MNNKEINSIISMLNSSNKEDILLGKDILKNVADIKLFNIHELIFLQEKIWWTSINNQELQEVNEIINNEMLRLMR